MSEGSPSAPVSPAATASVGTEATPTQNTTGTSIKGSTVVGLPAEKQVKQMEAEGEDLSADEIAALESAEESENSTTAVPKYKVKIDGKEVEVTQDELLSGYQRAKSSNKKYEEAAKMKKYADQIIEGVKNQPIAVLKQLGYNDEQIRKLTEDYLIEQMELDRMDPKDKELMAAKKELEKHRQKEEDEKKQKEQEDHAKLKTVYEDRLDNEIVEALEGAGLPITTFTVKRTAQYLTRAIDKDLPLSAKDIIKYVREDYNTDLNGYLSHYDGDALLNMLPKKVIDSIRKATVARVKGKTPANPTKTEQVAKGAASEEKESKKSPGGMSMSEFREWADKNSK